MHIFFRPIYGDRIDFLTHKTLNLISFHEQFTMNWKKFIVVCCINFLLQRAIEVKFFEKGFYEALAVYGLTTENIELSILFGDVLIWRKNMTGKKYPAKTSQVESTQLR